MISRFFGIVSAALFAIGSLLSIRDAGGPPSSMSAASADVERSEQSWVRYSSKPIRNIQPIADRVLADNPETPGQAPSDFGKFNRESWQIVRLEVPKPDGEWMRVTLARPLTWLETAARDDHGRLWLEFKELGIANWANVLAIEPCPEAAVGEGRLVTGKFEHSSAEVMDLFVDGVPEPIGTTSNHPFWSEDRQDFFQARKLRIREHLRLRDGSTPTVTAAVSRSQSAAVFNLEVDGEHVYYVAENGVLVHNNESYITEQEAIQSGLAHDANDRGGVRDPRHHGFPQEHRAFFEDRGIEIDDYTFQIPSAEHEALHGGGDWRLGREAWDDELNRQIMKRIEITEGIEGRQLTPDELLDILDQQLDWAQIPNNPIPFKS